MNKAVIIGSGIGVLALIGILIYFQSQRKVQTGIDYDLSPQNDVFGFDAVDQPPATTTASPTNTRATSIYSEPARSLIAQRTEIFMLSPVTMNRIKSTIGTGSNLFDGVPLAATEKIKQAFALKFGINPNSFLSYPLWTYKESPSLLTKLKSKNAPLTTWQRVGVQSFGQYGTPNQYFTVSEWGIDFSNLGLGTVQQYAPAIQRFFNNAAAEIEKLETAVKVQAIEFLRLPQNGGYKFLEYGD